MHAGRVVYLGLLGSQREQQWGAGGGGEAKAKCRQSFSVEISIGVGEKIVTFWPEAVVAILRRPPELWGGRSHGMAVCSHRHSTVRLHTVSGPLASFGASRVFSVRDHAR